jgi:hypothetical protein
MSIKKLLNDYGIGGILIILLVIYGLFMLFKHLSSKGMSGSESAQSMQSQYGGAGGAGGAGAGAAMSPGPNGTGSSVQPSDGLGYDETFASANGIQTSIPMMPSSCSTPMITNPAELLPKDTNSQWAELNPSGKGELSNVNLLRAGYNIGIDTIGSSLRNANQQIRSDPVTPMSDVSIWNQSTITPNFMQVPFEIGAGAQ